MSNLDPISFVDAVSKLGKGSVENWLLRVFTYDSVRYLSDAATEVSFERDQTIIQAGQLSKSFLLIRSGVTRSYIGKLGARRQITGFSLPGEFVALVENGRHSTAVDAVGSVRAYAFPREMMNICDRQAEIASRLRLHACRELRVAEAHLFILGRCNADEKLANFLLVMRERWATMGKMSVTVQLPMSRRDIADYLGMTMETASRTLARFAREKIVLFVPDGVRLLNIDRLEDLAVGVRGHRAHPIRNGASAAM